MLHYVELVVAGVAGANLLQHAVALAHAHRLRRAGAAAASREPLSPRQRQMLGLSPSQLGQYDSGIDSIRYR